MGTLVSRDFNKKMHFLHRHDSCLLLITSQLFVFQGVYGGST